MPAIYASLTVFLLFGAVSVAIYAAIYGINRPFDDRIAEMGVKMRVAYGNPDNVDMDSDSFRERAFPMGREASSRTRDEHSRAREALADLGSRRLSGVERRPHLSLRPSGIDCEEPRLSRWWSR